MQLFIKKSVKTNNAFLHKFFIKSGPSLGVILSPPEFLFKRYN